MKPIAAEWAQKAEADFATMQRECAATERPNYDGICFHAQQCVEKYLKVRPCEAGLGFGKIHDLVVLLDLALEIEPDWEVLREDLAYLSAFAVAFRYPGESADKESALNACDRCRRFRKAARQPLGLEP